MLGSAGNRRRALGLAFATLCAFVIAASSSAFADVAPHVANQADTDNCAMCHRSHSSASDVQFDPAAPESPAKPYALIVGTIKGGDTMLCYTCHGVDAAGSNTDVQSQFDAPSHHILEPSSSKYGPAAKQCSNCHDSHGTARSGGSTYPFLLRSKGANGMSYTGEQYCANCHTPKSSSGWDGLAVFQQTAHYSAIPTPAAGTDIRCSVCHTSHGSQIAPLIQPELTPPAVAATVAVAANDRRLCFTCHSGAEGTYPGQGTYQTSAHAVSSAGVSITAEWASADATRAVGECQVCHDPMGRSDGRGGVIPKLAQKEGPELCLQCHTVSGAASTDFRQLTYPATASPQPEVLAAWSPPASAADYSRLAVYTQDAAASVPRPLVGPREYTSPAGRVGRMAVGDIDGDGRNEVVLTVPGESELEILTQDALRGISATRIGALPIGAPADLVAAGDFFGDGHTEVATVNQTDAKLTIYRYSGSGLTTAAGPLALDASPSSIAVGDVTGSAASDIVVSALGADKLDIFTESGGSIVSAGSFATLSKPAGLSIGDAYPGGTKSEIVVLNTGEATNRLSVYNGAGADLNDYAVPGAGVVSASAVGDLITGSVSGSDVVVAVSSPTGTSTVDVFPQDGGGLASPQSYDTGPRYATGSLAVGDVDGDGRFELVIGNAGRSAIDGDRQLPSVQVMHQNTAGDAFDTGLTQTFAGGGVEMAGNAPSLAVADVGAVGPSRHPWGAVPGEHVSTETAPFARHVECTDCHEVHEATSTVAAAPAAYGAIKGAWGVSVTNDSTTSISYTERRGVVYEYELCFKCHSGWADPLQGRRNLAFEFNPKNPSVHAVEDTPTTSLASPDSFQPGWNNSSVMYCKDCHADAAAGSPAGPHSSPDAPLLSRPYLGTSPSDTQLLCYKCHQRDVYFTGDTDTGTAASRFKNGTAKLHSVHTSTWGFGCDSCHISHGSSVQPHLIRSDIGYDATSGGGSCNNGCHSGGTTYTR